MNIKDILSFLSDLKANNNREWFQENKPVFQKLNNEFVLFTEMIINELSQFDKAVVGMEAKKCVFRIYRDVRFSKDKSPYKTNFGAYMCPGGKNSGKAGYYMHLENEQSFIAGGIYMPPNPILNLVRTEIVNNTNDFLEIINDSDFKQFYGEINGEKLKNPPKGFSVDFEHIEILKFKSLTAVHYFDRKELESSDLFENIVRGFEILSPFNKFINQAIEG